MFFCVLFWGMMQVFALFMLCCDRLLSSFFVLFKVVMGVVVFFVAVFFLSLLFFFARVPFKL
jgi:hypothetical protein